MLDFLFASFARILELTIIKIYFKTDAIAYGDYVIYLIYWKIINDLFN